MVFIFGVFELKIVTSNVASGRGQLHFTCKPEGTVQNMVQRWSFLSIKEPSALSKDMILDSLIF